MGISRASKNLLAGIKGKLDENEHLNRAAGEAMDKKYPGGWAQSATNMTEFKQIKRGIAGSKRVGKGSGGGGGGSY